MHPVTNPIPLLLFERAASFVGLDFLAHEFWDRYIEFENRQEAPDRVFAILTRVIHIPMHQYARYYQTFRELMVTRPLGELAAPEVLARFRTEVESDPSYPGVQRPEHDIERDVRAKIDAMYYEVFTRTQTETSKRWTFESEITRPYFHVGELEHAQLSNWRKYLDFEEGEGEHSRIVALYERCLVTCAFYDEFWFRYARWMLAQEDKKEEVRHIYQRASTVFVPISRPGIRLQWAHFEEAFGRIDVARDIHMAIMATLPNCIEAVISLAHLNRRQSGLDAAIAVFKEQIDTPTIDILTKAVLVSQWAMLLVKVKGSIDEARQVFEANVEWYADSLLFWTKWLEFELDQPNSAQDEAQHSARLKNIFDTLRTKSRLSTTVKKRLSQVYLTYLEERGGKNAMMQFLTLDRDMFGPPSVSALSQANAGSKEGATHLGELDAATRAKAESNYLPYYKLHADPVPDATGPAPFQ
jgi:pre-mRNA-processing factor 39